MVNESRKILIIDDEEKNIKYLSLILEENGFSDIQSACNGVEGLEKVKKTRPDLIVLDIRMPKKNGLEVFNELKKTYAYKDIPIIFLTGEAEFLQRLAKLKGFKEDNNAQQADVRTVLQSFISKQPNAFLEKPIEPQDFMAAVSKVLN